MTTKLSDLDRLREAIERNGETFTPTWEESLLFCEFAERFLALTETGPDYEAAHRMNSGNISRNGTRAIVDAALADYLTEEET